MKKIALLLLMILNIAASAQTSKLYDKKRRLLIDKSYTIDELTYSNIQTIEKILLPKMYNSIKYTAISAENEFEGTVIVQLSVGAQGQDYEVKIVKPAEEELNKAVLKFFNGLQEYPRRQISPAKGKITVYIPITFEISKDNYIKLLNKNKSLTIQLIPRAPEYQEPVY